MTLGETKWVVAISGILLTQSRSAAHTPARAAALNGKPVGIIGASPGMTGSARGQSQLRQAFEFTNSYCMPQPEILVFRAHEKFDAGGNLIDSNTAELLARYMVAFREWILRFA